jgi:hypothetical protein
MSEKHQLSPDTVILVLSNILKSELSVKLDCSIEISFVPELVIKGLRQVREGQFIEIDIEVDKVKGIIKSALKNLDVAFEKYKAINDFRYYSYLIHTLVKGKVTHIHEDSIVVELDGIPLYSTCPDNKLIPSERGKIKLGTELYFYVNRLEMHKIGAKARTVVFLSRVSIKLPALLLSEFIKYAWEPTCTRRIVGLRSKIISPYPIPKRHILATSRALANERIKVVYHGK